MSGVHTDASLSAFLMGLTAMIAAKTEVMTMLRHDTNGMMVSAVPANCVEKKPGIILNEYL